MSNVLLIAALDQVRIGSLLQMLLTEGLTAVMTVQRGVTQGTITLRDGMIVDAELFSLSGIDAILSLMLWQQGELVVSSIPVEAMKLLPLEPLPVDPLNIMLEALRLQDHWDDLGDRTLLCTRPTEATGALADALRSSLTVAEVALTLHIPPVILLNQVEELLEKGIFARGKHQPGKAGLKFYALRLAWLEPSPAGQGEVVVPAVKAPVAQAPAVQAPAVQAPAVQAPVVQAPAVQAVPTPSTEAPAKTTRLPLASLVPPAVVVPPRPLETRRTALPMTMLQGIELSPGQAGAAPSVAPATAVRMDTPRNLPFSFLQTEQTPQTPQTTLSTQAAVPVQPEREFVVNQQPPTPAPPEPPPPLVGQDNVGKYSDEEDQAFYQLVNEGRQAFRRDDLAAAEALWQEATRRRPEDRTLQQNVRILQLKRSQVLK